MLQHTPGKWERILLARGPDGTQHKQIVAHGRGVMRIQHDASTEAHANADMMTAAPEMLAELQGWLAIFDRDQAYISPLVKTAILNTRNTIAKAIRSDLTPNPKE